MSNWNQSTKSTKCSEQRGIPYISSWEFSVNYFDRGDCYNSSDDVMNCKCPLGNWRPTIHISCFHNLDTPVNKDSLLLTSIE